MPEIFLAELLGTFFVVILGCGSIVLSQMGYFEAWVPPLVFGTTVGGMISVFRESSGAHFNPAVSLGFFALKKIDLIKMGLYCLAQVLGAIIGCLGLYALSGGHHNFGASTPISYTAITFFIEFMGSLLLMFVIVTSSAPSRPKILAPIAIGTIVAIISYGGGSYNPARTIGPAILSGHYIGVIFQILISYGGATTGALLARPSVL